jgi:hypothetical protein
MEAGYGSDLLRAVRADVALHRTPFAFIAAPLAVEPDEAAAAGLGVAIFSRDVAPSELRQQILACLPVPLRQIEAAPSDVGAKS